jgi:thymidine kinase
MKAQGKLTVICGSMYAGKSEELIRLARRSLYAKKRVQVFKPAIDDRYHQTMVVSHMGIQHEAEVVSSVAALKKAINKETQVLLIEEVQFFDASIAELLVEMADRGLDVVCAGLDQDFRRMPFGPMPMLLAAADEVIKLRAICMKCGAPASHTYRMVDGKPAHWDDPIVLIGATESYEARCRNCFEIRKTKRKVSRK